MPSQSSTFSIDWARRKKNRYGWCCVTQQWPLCKDKNKSMKNSMHRALMMLIHAKRSGHRINGFLYCSRVLVLCRPLSLYLQIKITLQQIEEKRSYCNPNEVFFSLLSMFAGGCSTVERGMSAILISSCVKKSNPKNIHFIDSCVIH